MTLAPTDGRLAHNKPITTHQRKLCWFIENFTLVNGYAPTVREIADHMGVSSANAAVDTISSLIKKGYVARERYKQRTIRVIKPYMEEVSG